MKTGFGGPPRLAYTFRETLSEALQYVGPGHRPVYIKIEFWALIRIKQHRCIGIGPVLCSSECDISTYAILGNFFERLVQSHIVTNVESKLSVCWSNRSRHHEHKISNLQSCG